MIADYEIAKLNIRIITDFDMQQSGSSYLFSSSFDNSDVEISIASGNIKTEDTPVYSDEFIKAYRCSDNAYSVVYYIVKNGKSINHFAAADNNCVLSCDCEAQSRDMIHFWGMIGLPHIFIEHRRLMLHCSYIVSDGKAILFCGKSGVGKSTQARLWEKYAGAKIINADKAVIYSENGKLYASSLPISGTSDICLNETAEVKAIVNLAKGDMNSARLSGAAEKASVLAQNCYFDFWRDGETVNVIDLCSEFSCLTSVIRFECLPEKSAVEYLKKVIE